MPPHQDPEGSPVVDLRPLVDHHKIRNLLPRLNGRPFHKSYDRFVKKGLGDAKVKCLILKPSWPDNSFLEVAKAHNHTKLSKKPHSDIDLIMRSLRRLTKVENQLFV